MTLQIANVLNKKIKLWKSIALPYLCWSILCIRLSGKTYSSVFPCAIWYLKVTGIWEDDRWNVDNLQKHERQVTVDKRTKQHLIFVQKVWYEEYGWKSRNLFVMRFFQKTNDLFEQVLSSIWPKENISWN